MTFQLTTNFTGEVGVLPRRCSLITPVSYTTLTTPGYLNSMAGMAAQIQPTDLISTIYNGGFGVFNPSITDGEVTLIPAPGFASNGLVTIGNIPQFLTTSGAYQDSGISASSITTPTSDYQQFVSLEQIIIASTGNWTRTRIAAGNYSLVHTAAADSDIVSFDITPNLRAAAGAGFKLASIDVIHQIGTLALTSQAITLSSVNYINNTAVNVVSIPLTGSLSTATQAAPYVDNVTVTTPAFLNTACAKYVAELAIVFQATSVYQIYGLNLHYSKSVI